MIEEWRDVLGYEGLYQISSDGRVRSVDRITPTKKGQRRYKGKLIASALHSAGYRVVNLSRGALGGCVLYVYRLVANAFLGCSDLCVNHKDLNKANNNLNNLEYTTIFENSLHAFKNDVRVGRTRLTSEQRKEIRKLRSEGLKLKQIAQKYSISESAVSEVARGTTWAWEGKNG